MGPKEWVCAGICVGVIGHFRIGTLDIVTDSRVGSLPAVGEKGRSPRVKGKEYKLRTKISFGRPRCNRVRSQNGQTSQVGETPVSAPWKSLRKI